MQNTCICGNKKPFEKCCKRFVSGTQYPKTPEQLMRSRYSAYALGGFGDYLLETWLPSMSQGLSSEELSASNTQWTRLSVIDKSQKGDDGIVEFKAFFVDEHGQEAQLHERSVFKRIKGKWLYVGGEVN
ncbi:MAG: YchJ family protein [Cellvibrionaceae bacterium]